MTVACRTAQGQACRQCYRYDQFLYLQNSLSSNFPEIAKLLHPTKNKPLTAEDISFASHDLVWWRCPKTCPYGCPHEYQARVIGKTLGGNGCHLCANNNGYICYHFSLEFRRPDIAKLWDHEENKELKPSAITSHNSRKVHWICEKGHPHAQVVADKVRGIGCAICKRAGYSKLQMEVLAYLAISYGCDFQHMENGGEVTIPGTQKRLDGYSSKLNLAIEVHGDYWHGNPRKYHRDVMNPSSKKTMGQLYDETLQKEALIKSKGYNLWVVWELDWNRGKKAVVKIQRLWRKAKMT